MTKEQDYIRELSAYIKRNLKKGYTKDSLKWALINQGHSRREVEKAMQRVDEELVQEAPLLKTKPDINYEVIEPKEAVAEKKSFWKRLFGL